MVRLKFIYNERNRFVPCSPACLNLLFFLSTHDAARPQHHLPS